jgi:hypothetical protein
MALLKRAVHDRLSNCFDRRRRSALRSWREAVVIEIVLHSVTGGLGRVLVQEGRAVGSEGQQQPQNQLQQLQHLQHLQQQQQHLAMMSLLDGPKEVWRRRV